MDDILAGIVFYGFCGYLLVGGVLTAQLMRIPIVRKHRKMGVLFVSGLTFLVSLVIVAGIGAFLYTSIEFFVNDVSLAAFQNMFFHFLVGQEITNPLLIEMVFEDDQLYSIHKTMKVFIWGLPFIPTAICAFIAWLITREKNTLDDDPRKKKREY